MPLFPKATTVLFALLPLVASGAFAEGAFAQQTCSGTLCDVLHLHETESATKWAEEQSAKTPKTSASKCSGTLCDTFHITPSTQTAEEWVMEQAAKRPKEPASDRCSGTVCDLFYKSKVVPAAAPPAPQQIAAVPDTAPIVVPKKSRKKKHVAVAAKTATATSVPQ